MSFFFCTPEMVLCSISGGGGTPWPCPSSRKEGWGHCCWKTHSVSTHAPLIKVICEKCDGVKGGSGQGGGKGRERDIWSMRQGIEGM